MSVPLWPRSLGNTTPEHRGCVLFASGTASPHALLCLLGPGTAGPGAVSVSASVPGPTPVHRPDPPPRSTAPMVSGETCSEAASSRSRGPRTGRSLPRGNVRGHKPGHRFHLPGLQLGGLAGEGARPQAGWQVWEGGRTLSVAPLSCSGPSFLASARAMFSPKVGVRETPQEKGCSCAFSLRGGMVRNREKAQTRTSLILPLKSSHSHCARFERRLSVEKWHRVQFPSSFDIRIAEHYIHNCQPMVPGTDPRQQESPVWAW